MTLEARGAELEPGQALGKGKDPRPRARLWNCGAGAARGVSRLPWGTPGAASGVGEAQTASRELEEGWAAEGEGRRASSPRISSPSLSLCGGLPRPLLQGAGRLGHSPRLDVGSSPLLAPEEECAVHIPPQPPRRCGDEPRPGQPPRPSRAPFVYRALCLRQTDPVCFSSSRSLPPPPCSPGSWNALLTLPFPEGLRPCSLPGNWAWHP